MTASTLLHAVDLRKEETAKMIQQLEAIISDSSLGVVSRTKAKVELALLKNDDDHNKSLEDEMAAIKESNGVSKNKQKVEENVKRNQDRAANELAAQNHLAELSRLSQQIRQEAKQRSEEARIRLAEAEAVLREAEKEAVVAMSKAKRQQKRAIMKRRGRGGSLLHQESKSEGEEEANMMAKAEAAAEVVKMARGKVKEKRTLLEEADVAEKSNIKELERLEKEEISKLEADDATIDTKKGMDVECQLHAEEEELLRVSAISSSVDGLSILKRLRGAGDETPVMFRTAKDEIGDRVAGLRSGADDYLVKPFALEELLARIEALCRRTYQKATNEARVAD